MALDGARRGIQNNTLGHGLLLEGYCTWPRFDSSQMLFRRGLERAQIRVTWGSCLIMDPLGSSVNRVLLDCLDTIRSF